MTDDEKKPPTLAEQFQTLEPAQQLAFVAGAIVGGILVAALLPRVNAAVERRARARRGPTPYLRLLPPGDSVKTPPEPTGSE